MFRVALDFDGVLVPHVPASGWRGPHVAPPPLEGAVGFVADLVAQGAEITIHTCRLMAREGASVECLAFAQGVSVEETIAGLEEWRERYGFPAWAYWTRGGKPVADVYVDDRAVYCDGLDFAKTLRVIGGRVSG